jgi:hypothetical protein
MDSQTQSDWEHLIVVDMPSDSLTKDHRKVLASIPSKQNRSHFYCDKKHSNYGHTCRHQIWGHAKGDYILYIDDDDYFADRGSLGVLDSVTEPWAVFPILRHGRVFFNLPPGLEKTGTGMFMHRKEIGRWPDSDLYEADGLFVEELKQRHKYQVVDSMPVVVQPKSSFGISNTESWFGEMLMRRVSLWLRIRHYAKALRVRRIGRR